MIRVKICGLRRLEDALTAVDEGAGMLGFVFAPSRRQIDPESARDLIAGVRERGDIHAVGVFVNASADEMNRIAALCDLDYVQLSGCEDDDVIADLDVPAIKTLHVSPGMSSRAIAGHAGATSAPLLHLDTARSGAYGGTGQVFDWSLLPEFDRPALLAGGLTPNNVTEAIQRVQPWGVDVSSGVETDAHKDPVKIRQFIRAALSAG